MAVKNKFIVITRLVEESGYFYALIIRFFNTWIDRLVTIEYEGNICYNSLENENREIKERLWKLVLGHL